MTINLVASVLQEDTEDLTKKNDFSMVTPPTCIQDQQISHKVTLLARNREL